MESIFTGQYRCNLDGKGRLVIPQDYRNQIGLTVVVNKGFEKCITVYPVKEWQKFVTQISSLSIIQKENRAFNRYYISTAFSKELDSQGRVNLDDSLIKYADITKECIIVGVGSVLEIWALDKWIEEVENKRDSELEDISSKMVL